MTRDVRGGKRGFLMDLCVGIKFRWNQDIRSRVPSLGCLGTGGRPWIGHQHFSMAFLLFSHFHHAPCDHLNGSFCASPAKAFLCICRSIVSDAPDQFLDKLQPWAVSDSAVSLCCLHLGGTLWDQLWIMTSPPAIDVSTWENIDSFIQSEVFHHKQKMGALPPQCTLQWWPNQCSPGLLLCVSVVE